MTARQRFLATTEMLASMLDEASAEEATRWLLSFAGERCKRTAIALDSSRADRDLLGRPRRTFGDEP
jgi:hypothetical protein